MGIIYFDIETVPDPDLQAELKPEPKYGNAKKEEKRAEILERWEVGGQIKAMSVDPYMNKIVALKIYDGQNFIDNGKTEVEMLNHFWQPQMADNLFVGYNVINFDIPTIIARSILLGVEPRREIVLKRYSREPIYDLAMVICQWDMSKLKKMDWYLKRFGLPTKSGDGSQVYEMYQAGQIKEINEYCEQDVLANKALFEKIIEFYPIKERR